MDETARNRAKRLFWPTVTGHKWAWICLGCLGLAGTGAGVYFSSGHARTASVVLTMLWAAIGLLSALVVIFLSLWFVAPRQQRDELRGDVTDLNRELSEAHDEIEALRNPPVTLRFVPGFLTVPIFPFDPFYAEYAQSKFPGEKVEVLSVTDYWVRVDNDSAIDVSGVRVRVSEVEPAGAALQHDLPHDLPWHGPAPMPRTRDIPAGGHDFVVLTTRVELSGNRVIWTDALAPGLLQGMAIFINLEVWWQGKSMDRVERLRAGRDQFPAPPQPASQPPPTGPNGPQPNRAARRASTRQSAEGKGRRQ